jgi:acetoin utilization deacetylase AcuC-like enzyme
MSSKLKVGGVLRAVHPRCSPSGKCRITVESGWLSVYKNCCGRNKVTTGLVYHPVYLEHNQVGHPENSGRLEHTLGVLDQSGVMDRLTMVEPRPATAEELERVHSPAHIELVRRVAESGGGMLDPDTYANRRSYDAALMAAGGLLALVEAVSAGDVENGFALVRPPGHHATQTRAMGFCLFNNVAVAARHALNQLNARRVLIVDFDVHHGNGTQDIFDQDAQVAYVSTHQYPYYPGTGNWNEVGDGDGKGTILDVPLPGGVGDSGYAAIFEDLVWPLVKRFDPDLILVSAGYDAHWQDPLAMMMLSLSGYAHMAKELVSMAKVVCDGRIVFALEGGYHLDVLAHGVLNSLYALLGEDQVSDPLGVAPAGGRSVDDLVARLRDLHNL